MKILYVDLQYDYGMKHRGPNEIGDRGFRQVFQKLGHAVEVFYYDDYLQRLPELQVLLLEKAKLVAPDLIYFNLFGDQFDLSTLDQLKKEYKTINWFGDDQWRFDKFTSKYAPHFTYCVTTDPFALKKYHNLGLFNVVLSQWASMDYELDEISTSAYKYDVSFIGGSHSVRRWFISELEKRNIRVAAFGHGWPNGVLSLKEMGQLFAQSKINLNLSNSVNCDLRYLMHNFKNMIVALKSDKSASQIKARNFEIPYFGGFQLTEYVPFLESYLSIGQEVACFRDIDEAALLIKYYLQNDLEREKIKSAGVLKARQCHTYFQRHKNIFEQIK